MKTLERIFKYISAALLFCIAMTIFVQVITRYILGLSISWTEEAARFFCVWMVFTGAIVATLRQAHIRISFLLERTSGKTRTVVDLLTCFVVIQFLIIVFVGSLQLISQNWRQTAVTLPISISWLYVPAAIFSFASIVALLLIARKSTSSLRE